MGKIGDDLSQSTQNQGFALRTLLASWSFRKIVVVGTLFMGMMSVWLTVAGIKSTQSQFSSEWAKSESQSYLGRVAALKTDLVDIGRNKKSLQISGFLKALATADPRLIGAAIYDSKGRLIMPDHVPSQQLKAAWNWERIAVSQAKTTVQSAKHKGIDVADMTLMVGENDPVYLRVVVANEQISKAFSKIKIIAGIINFLCTAVGAIFLYLACQRTLFQPLMRMTSFLRRTAADIENIPEFKVRTTDSMEVKSVVKSLFDGLGDISYQRRCQNSIEKSRKKLNIRDKNLFLKTAQVICAESGLAEGCRMFVVRKSDDRFVLEDSPDLNADSGIVRSQNATGNRDGIHEMRFDSVVQFLKSGDACKWSHKMLYVRCELDSDLIMVAMVMPKENMGQRKIEDAILLWLHELAHLFLRQTRGGGNHDFYRELQKQNITHTDNSPSHRLDSLIGHEVFQSRLINGHFLCVFRNESREQSLVFFGKVNTSDLRAGILAHNLIQQLNYCFAKLSDKMYHMVQEEILKNIFDYIRTLWDDNTTLSMTSIFFLHRSGQGFMTSHGQVFPYVISPQERKPMIIVPLVSEEPFGIQSTAEFAVTPFSILPGQVVFAFTDSVLKVEDANGMKFEKVIQRGGISEINAKNAQLGAQNLLSSYYQAIRDHAGSIAIREDLVCVTFMSAAMNQSDVMS